MPVISTSAPRRSTAASARDAEVRAAWPRTILLDFGGTLDADGVPAVGQFHAAYAVLGGTRDLDAFAPAFRASDHALALLPGIAQLDYTRTVAAQATRLAALLPDEGALDWAAVAARVMAAAHAIAARNRPVLLALRAHARLGVVSNFTGNVDRCLDELGLLELFETVADSAVVGHSKPDPALFRAALTGLNARPGDTMMVGDNPYADVRAAAELGMRSCWVAPAERSVPEGCAPTYRIARLPEVLDVLGIDVLGGAPNAAGATPAAS